MGRPPPCIFNDFIGLFVGAALTEHVNMFQMRASSFNPYDIHDIMSPVVQVVPYNSIYS